MLAKLTVDKPRNWDLVLDLALFAYREVPQISTGFSPLHLLFGREPRGPLQLLKENWIRSTIFEYPVTDYMKELKKNIQEMCALAEGNIKCNQEKQKKIL